MTSGPGWFFGVRPAEVDEQREQILGLLDAATAEGARVVVLPELTTTEQLIADLQSKVGGDHLALLVAGSCHRRQPDHDDGQHVNEAVAWLARDDRRPARLAARKHEPFTNLEGQRERLSPSPEIALTIWAGHGWRWPW